MVFASFFVSPSFCVRVNLFAFDRFEQEITMEGV